MTLKFIGVKDEQGEEVCLINLARKDKIPPDLWNKYKHISTFWTAGDKMAKMVVKKKILEVK